MSEQASLSYCDAIRQGFEHLLQNHPNVFAIGQGLWSPWYVGNTMLNLEKQFGRERIIDTPVSEQACTGAALGAALCGFRPIVIHPRMDFMILATDQIVNQAAKWKHMLGGQPSAAVTIRSIINRGGEQGAQHSQALHAWYAHIPGLRVVMPATPRDARDLLIAATLSDDPVLYIDDRWLYDVTEPEAAINLTSLDLQGPVVRREGTGLTLIGAGHSAHLCLQAAEMLARDGVSAEVIDLRILNPLRYEMIAASVSKTGRLCAVDGGWRTCGLAGEIIAGVMERIEPSRMKAKPMRITLPDAPAPTSSALEDIYYTKAADITIAAKKIMAG